MPASMMAASTFSRLKACQASAVRISKYVGGDGKASMHGAISASAAAKRGRESCRPPTRIRSVTHSRCGDRYVPTLRPARESSASRMTQVVPLPLLPVTRSAGMPRCGSPRSARSARTRERSPRLSVNEPCRS